MKDKIKKRWQNLVFRKCPCCNSRLERPPEALYVQACPSCEFAISDNKFLFILKDKNHIMHGFLSDNERGALKEILTEENHA